MKPIKLFTLLLSVLFFACNEDDIDIPIDASSQDNTIIAVNLENSVKEIDDTLDDLVIYSDDFFSTFNNLSPKNKKDNYTLGRRFGFFRKCTEIEIEEIDNKIKTTITFNGECNDRSGNAIAGTVFLTTSSSDSDLENLMSIANLSISGYMINGTRTYTILENNETGDLEIQVAVDITISNEEGTISKVEDRKVKIDEGDNMESIEDNIKTITGSFVYKLLFKELKMEITTPLIKPALCDFIVSGIKTYTIDEDVSTLDYGDGTCDNIAILTLPDDTQEEILLEGRGIDLDDNTEEDEDFDFEDEDFEDEDFEDEDFEDEDFDFEDEDFGDEDFGDEENL